MEGLGKCTGCGTDLLLKRESSIQGLFCKNCGWRAVTTYIEEIVLDRKTYKVYLLEADFKDIEQIRTVSKAQNIGYIKAKPLLQEKGSLLYSGYAVRVKEICEEFHKVGIKYCIEPEFPYDIGDR